VTKFIHKTLSVAFLVLIMTPTARVLAADKVTSEERSTSSIVDIARESGSFETLLAALDAAGLTDLLDAPGVFTVFAPTDEAFAQIPSSVIQSLLQPENKKNLQEILLYHVLAGEVSSEDAISAALSKTKVSTLSGSTLSPAFENASLVINRSEVLSADLKAGNGRIHVIDRVLIPFSQRLDVIDTAATYKELSSFVSLVKSADLEDTLRKLERVDVFAPTNAAFEALPADVLERLLEPENREELSNLLQLHVASSFFRIGSIVTSVTLTSLQGDFLTIKYKSGELFVNDVKIKVLDIPTSNGSLQIIDAVLEPKG